MKNIITLILILGSITICNSQQLGNFFTIKYTASPSTKDFDINNTKLNFNILTKLGKGYLTNSFGIDYTTINYNQNYPFNTDEIDNFYRINYSLSYTYQLKKNWRLTARATPTIASNFEGKFTSEDILFNGALLASKNWGTLKKGSTLTFGLAYAALSGRPSVFPFINFRQRINKHFSYELGFPNMSVKYNLNTKNSFKIGLKQQGFNINLSGNNGPVINGEEAQKFRSSNLLTDLEYSYKISNLFRLNTSIGYSLTNRYVLANEDRVSIFNFNVDKRRIFFNIGISYDLKGLIKNKNNPKNKF